MSILATVASVLAILFGAHTLVKHQPRTKPHYAHYVLNSTAYCEAALDAETSP
jgi:hypothetical protein